MIRYTLKCGNDHRFDSWFQSASAYEKLRTAKHLVCEICGDTDISKAIMAPQIRAARDKAAPPAPQAEPQTAPQTGADTPDTPSLAELKAHVEANSEYVGKDFVSEARKINDGDAPGRPIYGEAKPAEALSLLREGVPVAPLPFVPTRKTN